MSHLEPLQPILLALERALAGGSLLQARLHPCLPPLQLLLRRLHLARQLGLARLQLALPLRHAPQPRVESVQLAVSLGARSLQRLLLLCQRAVLGCSGRVGDGSGKTGDGRPFHAEGMGM